MLNDYFRLEKLGQPFEFDVEELGLIASLRPFRPGAWDSPAASEKVAMGTLKKTIKTRLEGIQGRFCVYCGWSFELVGSPERDHIAPKSVPANLGFLFTPANLVLACHECNGPIRKGRRNVVSNWSANYEDCSFSIVHPYFDDIADHVLFELKTGGLAVKAVSEKGRQTIEMFELDGVLQTMLRAKILAADSVSLDQKESEQLLAIQDGINICRKVTSQSPTP